MNDQETTSISSRVLTFLIVAGASLFFCSKGVFVKSAYQHGADALTILALRMLFALPIFAVVGIVTSRRAETRLTPKLFGAVMALGFVGYYVSSLVNFTGLQYISVGLERMVLYTYPTLVLFGSAVFLKKPAPRASVIAAGVAYLGIVAGFFGEAKTDAPLGELVLGVGLVFTSAVTYAAFMLCSGEVISMLGALRFTSLVVGISCLFVLAHFAIARDVRDLFEQSHEVYTNGAILAIFGTVLPSFLLMIVLNRAGATKSAVIGCIGPVGTVVLAWAVLGERMNAAQTFGLGLTIAGGLMIALKKA